MENEDLKLGEKATEINRQFFVEAIALFKGTTLVENLRLELEVPKNGFENEQIANRWLNPPDEAFEVTVERHHRLKNASMSLMKTLHLSVSYLSATRYYLLTGKIGHIPGNFLVTITPDREISIRYLDIPKTGERRLVDKLWNHLWRIFYPSSVARRDRKNSARDDEALVETRNKETMIEDVLGVEIRDLKSDTELASRIFKSPQNDPNFDISKSADQKRGEALKKARHRSKKRHES